MLPEERKVIQIAMIDFPKQVSCDLLNLSEINQNPALIQLHTTQNYLNFPVVAMKILTSAAEISQIVCRRKISDDFDFVEFFFHIGLPSLNHHLLCMICAE